MLYILFDVFKSSRKRDDEDGVLDESTGRMARLDVRIMTAVTCSMEQEILNGHSQKFYTEKSRRTVELAL